MPSGPESYGRYALMALTSACNQKCVMCFEDGVRYDVPGMPELRRTLDRLAERGFGKVVFIGGEVTLVPELPEVIGEIASRGMGAHITTNGLRLADAGLLGRLVDAGLRHIEFSFHAHRQPESALITGREDSLDLQIEALSNIAGFDALTFNTNTVITKTNEGLLRGIADVVLKNPRAVAMSFKYPTFEGRMKKNAGSAVRFDGLAGELDAVRGMCESRGAEIILDGFPLCVLATELIPRTVAFIDADSMLFGYHYFERVENYRFDLMPPKVSDKCGGCVMSPVCCGFPGEYLDAFSDGEVRPFWSFFDLPREVMSHALRALGLRRGKDVLVAVAANLKNNNGIVDYPGWVDGVAAAAAVYGMPAVLFDLSAGAPDEVEMCSFMRALPGGKGPRLTVRCDGGVFAGGAAVSAYRAAGREVAFEIVLRGCSEDTHGEGFRRACLGMMALVAAGAPVFVYVPVDAGNAAELSQLARLAGMSGCRGIRVSCKERGRGCVGVDCAVKAGCEKMTVVCNREHPDLEIAFEGFDISCLPRHHSRYEPPFYDDLRNLENV